MDDKGKTISEQDHSYLLSLYTIHPRSFELREGENNGELRFAINLPEGISQFRVQLKSAFELEDTGKPLVSNVVVVSIP